MYILGQSMDDLLNCFQVIVFVFQCPKGFYVHISLGMFVSCPMMVKFDECNILLCYFFQSLMSTTIHVHFKKTCFVIICCKKSFCCVWDGNG